MARDACFNDRPATASASRNWRRGRSSVTEAAAAGAGFAGLDVAGPDVVGPDVIGAGAMIVDPFG